MTTALHCIIHKDIINKTDCNISQRCLLSATRVCFITAKRGLQQPGRNVATAKTTYLSKHVEFGVKANDRRSDGGQAVPSL